MGFKWGKVFNWGLVLMGIGFLLTGCSTQEVTKDKEVVSQTILLNLPKTLGEGVESLQWSASSGDFNYQDAPDRFAKFTISAPTNFEDQIEGIQLSWAKEGGVLRPILDFPVEELPSEEIQVALDLTYPASELPKKLEIKLGTGEVSLVGFQGQLDVEVADGTCLLEKVELAADSKIQTGGWLRADLAKLQPGLVSLRADFGYVEVNLPPEAGLRVEAETQMGEIFNNLSFSYLEPSSPDDFGARLGGWLNAGGSELKVFCTNGDIYFEPRQSRR